MDKLNVINKSINEIREILGEECANIEQLPDMIRSLATDPSRSGFTTAFVFSSESYPNTPTSGSLDTATGLVVGLEDGWSQGIEERAVTYSMRSVPTTNWMSFAIFDPSGERVTEWSSPTNLKGPQGEQGRPGDTGAMGPAGPKGEKGDSSNSYRTVSVYTSTETTDTPAKPVGGHWDLETNEVTKPTSETGVQWYLSADEPEKNNYLWMSQGTFGESGDLISDWCSPFRLTGEAGKNGADGRVTEFIYRLVPDFDTYKELETQLFHNKLYSPQYEDDVIPQVNDTLNIGTVWTDQPLGITEALQIEACCTRTRRHLEEPWSEWSACVMWSKWGENGMDGDGVEYIYLVTPDKTNEGNDITSEYVATHFMPNRDYAMTLETYQEDEFVFNDEWGFEGYDWTDEPQNVGPAKPLEWVSVRKKKRNDNGDILWGRFSDPTIWGRFASDGYSYLTSFVFTRSVTTPDVPTGGNYAKPSPDEEIWKDTIPSSSEMTGPVWMSTRVFYAGDENFDSSWTEPKIIADTHDFQVEYSDASIITRIDKFTGDEESWRAAQPEKWGDDSEIIDPIWMATASCDNGVWSDWVITRIKGEKGDRGDDGTSVEIKYKIQTKAELLKEWTSYLGGGSFFNILSEESIKGGLGVYVGEEGLLYVYSGGYYPGEDGNFDLYWTSVELKGESGDSAYLYTAFADIWNGKVTVVKDGAAMAGKYIGVCPSTAVLSDEKLEMWDTYVWTQWKGEDGWGYEQIFLLTHKDAHFNPATGVEPDVPTDSPAIKEYLPKHNLGNLAKGDVDQSGNGTWADSPLSVSEEWPYCWVVSRSVAGDEFKPWVGDADGSGAALYSRHSFDGVPGESAVVINLTNDIAVIPMEGDQIDPDFLGETITTGLQIFIGDDPVPSDQTEVYVENGYATWDEDKDLITLNLSNLPGDVSEIPIKVKVKGGPDHVVTWKLFKTDTSYELNPTTHVIKRFTEGVNAGLLESPEFRVKVSKWDGSKWIASNKAVFVEATVGYNKEYYSNTEDSNVVSKTTGGYVTIDLSGIKHISTLTVYLTDNDLDTGNRISFEDIAIVADGATGPKGEDGAMSEEQKQAIIDSAMANFNAAAEDIRNDIDKAKEELNKAIQDEQNARLFGDTNMLEQAESKLAAATANLANQEKIESAIKALEEKYFETSDDGKTTLRSGVLNETDIWSLSMAALGEDAPADLLPDGSISKDSYFGKYFAGAVGVFGDLIASNITADNIFGTEISGKTIKSDKVEVLCDETEGPTWQINNDGDGYLAKKNIEWDTNGELNVSGEKLSIANNNIFLTKDEISPEMKPENLYKKGELAKGNSYFTNSVEIAGIEFPDGHMELCSTNEAYFTISFLDEDWKHIKNIGYICKNGQITIHLLPAFGGNISSSSVTGGTGNGSRFLTSSYEFSTKPDRCVYIKLMLLQKDGTYSEVQRTSLTQWLSCYDFDWENLEPITQPTASFPHALEYYTHQTITVPESGIYSMEVVFPATSITGINPTGGLGEDAKIFERYVCYRFGVDVDRNIKNFTQISPNGLISKSDNCTLFMYDNSIDMVATRTGESLYGFRVTPSGIYYCNGGASWTRWTPN